MNIAFFVSAFPVISETFIVNQITGLIDRGHNVDIFASRPGSDSITHQDVDTYDLLKRTHLHGNSFSMMPKNKLKRLSKACGLLASNINVNPRLIGKSLNVFQFGKDAATLNLFYRTLPYLKAPKPYDIIHCHFGENGALAAPLKAMGILNGKIATTFHGSDMSQYLKRKGSHVYDFLFRTGDLFLPISETWKTELINLGCPPEKTRVHRMGIDTSKFSVSPRNSRTCCNILTVARLVEKKGLKYAILALAEMIRKFPDLEFTYRIAGDGPLRENLQDLIAQSGLDNQVQLLGWKRQDEILDLMKDADLFLLPSVTDSTGDKEGIPVVLMESMALGLPVVSTYHSGIPELVKNNESGFLVQERDVSALSERIALLLRQPETMREMGLKGRRFVEQNYDINRLNNQLEATFSDLLTSA